MSQQHVRKRLKGSYQQPVGTSMIKSMDQPPTPPRHDACYRALKARDARFDGCFFTGVTSTGIYCRPVCRVRTPKQENCRFFNLAAQAEQAGFRPCLRCRPELAPRHNALQVLGQAWSMQDASAILAGQAAALMDVPPAPGVQALTIHSLAQRLGISDRHLRRIFEAQFGVSPLVYLQTRRLLCAKQLLTDTPLAVSQVASLSGFASVRRFNAAFATHYGLNPTQLRRAHTTAHAAIKGQGIHVTLSYRPPYNVAAMLQFLRTRALTGIEVIDPNAASLGRTLSLPQGTQVVSGWLWAQFDETRCQVHLQVSDSLCGVLPTVLARVRAWLDLDADPRPIDQLLQSTFPNGCGMRVPGTTDGFELAVRAVLGQQITVAAARTLTQRLVARFGTPIQTPLAGLDWLFPLPQTLAAPHGDALGEALGTLGIVKQRQAAILALAHAVAGGQLCLDTGSDVHATLAQLQALPGIGDWTAHYIAMRALRWPDAFLAGDVALHKALGLQDSVYPAKTTQAVSLAWQPWRSYAVIRAWAQLQASTSTSSTQK